MPRRYAEESTKRPKWTVEDATDIGTTIGIDWDTSQFDPEDFLEGLKIELEHGTKDERTNVTDDDPELTGKIAWAHLLEDPEYYTILKAVEERAKSASVPEPFLPIADLERTLGSLSKKYAELTQHRMKILRRASALAKTIAALEPTDEVLGSESTLRRLATNALTAADHLDTLANGVREVQHVAAAVRSAQKKS